MRMPLAEHQSNKVTMAINKRQRKIGVDIRLRKSLPVTAPSSLLLFPSLPLPQFWPLPSFPTAAPTPAPPGVRVTSPEKKKKRGVCQLCSARHKKHTPFTYLQRQNSTKQHNDQRVSSRKHTERFDLVFARVHALHGCDNGPNGGYCHCDVHRGGENERGY